MGSMVEINDTLQISEAQGFPVEFLDIIKRLESPYTIDSVKGKTFGFKNKPAIRVFQQPPIRCSFVQNLVVNGIEKWLYWGTCIVTETIHDNINRTTSGKFEIVSLHTPDEMKTFFKLRDGRKEFDYFAQD